MEKEKPVIFQGAGYRVIRYNPLNVSLEVQNTEGTYIFKGYFQTIENALCNLMHSEYLLEGSEEKRTLAIYLKEVREAKETIINDIKNYFNNGRVEEEPITENLDEYDLLG